MRNHDMPASSMLITDNALGHQCHSNIYGCALVLAHVVIEIYSIRHP